MPQNIRYALRQLRKSPGFTAVALITLALCIGANLTIFAVVDSILLRPLPFPHSDRLVTLYSSFPKAGKDRDGFVDPVLRTPRKYFRLQSDCIHEPEQVLAYFLGVGTKLLLLGVALGVLGTWMAGRAMESVLFGVGAFQIGVLAATLGVMMLVVLLACFIPARRAAQVDPMVALRYE
jgi:hypothetical protein